MVDISGITSQSSSLPRTRTHPIKTRPDPEPTLAFGFVLDYQCRLRWAKYFLNECQKNKPSKFTPEQFKERRSCLMLAINTTLPDRVYRALPDLPRLRRRLLPIEDGGLVYNRWVFALRDNSTSRNLHSPLTQEDIAAVRKELGLEDDQQPRWVPIARCVQ